MIRQGTSRTGPAARRTLTRLLTAGLLLGAVATAGAAAADLPPPPTRYFDDRVGLLPEADAARLADALAGFDQRTGIQFVVTVLPELDGDLETTVTSLYQAWGIGRKTTDRGVLFAVFPRQGQTRIEVGYGLEDSLPDVVASRILRRMMEMPREPAVARFAFVIQQVAGAVAPGDPLASGATPRRAAAARHGRGVGVVPFLFLVFIVLRLARRGGGGGLGPLIIASALGNAAGGGRGGWGGGGGGFGGFSGGGGMSGGGGASGGW
ncbi:MAG: TPM domain-containing protein [Candidatus Krumholzibacteriia bacterium]